MEVVDMIQRAAVAIFEKEVGSIHDADQDRRDCRHPQDNAMLRLSHCSEGDSHC